MKDLTHLINNISLYFAHIRETEDGMIVHELLSEHIQRTEKYFKKIADAKKINTFVDRFIYGMFGSLSEEAQNFLVQMIYSIPTFHDFGKINPEFQKAKMNNKNICCENAFFMINSRHSLISSVMYIDYYLSCLKTYISDSEERKKIRPFIFYHAYIICCHHSDLKDYSDFIDDLLNYKGRDIIQVFREGKCNAYAKSFSIKEGSLKNACKQVKLNEKQSIWLYAYVKLLYSILVASDYYATSEFKSGKDIIDFGDLGEIRKWNFIYEQTPLMKKIRLYEKDTYLKSKGSMNINDLRTELLLDSEREYKLQSDKNIFYLEAPTGSGKSNAAINLSLKMIDESVDLQKVFYIYPFNTLVEQNKHSLEKCFQNNMEIIDQIAVVNSLTPIKLKTRSNGTDEMFESDFQKALLDHQFLNYPMVISTHVSLFDTMFGNTKESTFAFHQLMNSVIVLDEIQSYKYKIWGEIIAFLNAFSYLLNIKVIVMSATLPRLNDLIKSNNIAVQLIKNRNKYFLNPCFRNRVSVSYELLDTLDDVKVKLIEYIMRDIEQEKKVLVEFIKKSTAKSFFDFFVSNKAISDRVEYMSGDDSISERSRILKSIEEKKHGMILIATQVVEAGVDIDMDVGYKNISKLDCEEQFMGRINRSCKKNGKVYLFKLDEACEVYRDHDIRLEKRYTVEKKEMRDILDTKNYRDYYRLILNDLLKSIDSSYLGLDLFLKEEVGKLKWESVKNRMKLIEDNEWSMPVYLSRIIIDENGNHIDGKKVWESYKELLFKSNFSYAQHRIKLSQIRTEMHNFIYQLKKNNDLIYNDKVGEIVYIEDGEKYFDHGKLNREKIQGEIGEFIDFI